MMSKMIHLRDLKVHGGPIQLYSLRRQQCEEKCIEEDLCFAFEYPKSKMCWLFQKDKHSNIIKTESRGFETDTSEDFGTFIFYDDLKLLGQAFMLDKVKIKSSIKPKESILVANRTLCSEKCRKDRACAVAMFAKKIKQAPPPQGKKMNCDLYHESKFECPEDANECVILEQDKQKNYEDYVVIFNP